MRYSLVVIVREVAQLELVVRLSTVCAICIVAGGSFTAILACKSIRIYIDIKHVPFLMNAWAVVLLVGKLAPRLVALRTKVEAVSSKVHLAAEVRTGWALLNPRVVDRLPFVRQRVYAATRLVLIAVGDLPSRSLQTILLLLLVLVQVLQDRLVDRLVLVDVLQLARDLLLPPFAQVVSQQVVVGDLPQADQPSLGRIWRCAVDAASQYWTQLPCIDAVLGSLSLFLMRE